MFGLVVPVEGILFCNYDDVASLFVDGAGKPSRTLSWWCFNPGIAMQEFARMGVGSIILTSGTLSPMDSFAQELKLLVSFIYIYIFT